MATVSSPAPRVNPERQPFRPLIAPPAVSYWTDDLGAVRVLLSSRRQADAYELIPISTDIGGAAFRWFKSGGECYDVLASGTDSQYGPAGFCYTGGCKHVQTTAELLELGVLNAAPGSAAGECDDAA